MVDFNQPPYFDDYDENKGYYKVLFRPSVAVQARELNQMQTMLQKQIERFGANIFREGSLVVGGAFDLELDIAYIKASAVAPEDIDVQTFVGKKVVGATSGIQAFIRAVDYDPDLGVYVFLLRYLSSSATSTVFLTGENVALSDNAGQYFTVATSSPSGYGSIFSISQGVVYSKGYFIAFPTQTVILNKYSQTPSTTVGLQLSEAIVTELTDETLLDNAQGSYNENAPGAHRYAINAVLTSLDYVDGVKQGYDTANFVPLLDIENGVLQSIQERSQYSRIYDEMAKRTYDESGDYYVKGFNTRTREHLDTGDNEGLYTLANGGDPTKLSIDVEPGVAYVKGYEVNKLVTTHVITDKSLDYSYVNNQLINARTGGYFLVKEMIGSPTIDVGQIINLYDSTQTGISSNKTISTAASGTAIGTARVKAIVYESGTLGTSSGVARIYLYDINMTTGVFSAVRSIGAQNYFYADVILTNVSGNTAAVLNDQNQNVLLFPIGAGYTRTIRSNTGSTDTSFYFQRTSNATTSFSASNGTFSISVTTSGVGTETLPYSDGSLSTTEKRQLVVSIANTVDFRLAGTVSNTSANVIVGSGTNFTKLSVGDRIKIGSAGYYFIANVNSATSIQLANNLAASVSSNVFYKTLQAGDVLDLTASGSTGLTRTATVSSGIMSINLEEDTSISASPTSATVQVTYDVNRSSAAEIKKILRPHRYVVINTSTNPATNIGPYDLGISDIYQLRSVRMKSTAFATVTDGTDVTSSFTLDNGQRDSLYDHGKIINTGGLNLANVYLLVEFDHFQPDYSSGYGYFSVDSYPVNDSVESDTTIFTYQIPKYKSTSGYEYNLRDVFDYRPVKAATATSATTLGVATTNPTNTTSLNGDTLGLRIAAPDTVISADYSYYLARRDIVTLDKEGIFNIIKGEASVSPITPNVPDSVMGIANIYIPPYPSISETLARILNDRNIGCVSKKIANIRYTMREIGVLKNRIENLEYYNALTLLEKSAVALKITNEDGLDRFKNGFFVDGFLDHSLGATYNPDYKIAIDKQEQTIRPKFNLDSFKYQYLSGQSSGVQNTGGMVTLPYTSVALLENKNVTSYRNIEQSVFRFIGTIELTPDNDTWIDTNIVDKTIEFGNDTKPDQVLKTEWGSWTTYAVGYNVYDRNYGDTSGTLDPKKFLGSYTSYAAAVAASKSTPYYKNNVVQGTTKDDRAIIETVSSDKRVGIQTVVTTETNTEALGNFVTDVSIIPYIRPQIIKVYGKGLKANTLYHVYFDGEDMSDFVTPIIIPDNGNVTAPIGFLAEGANFRSDAYGQVLGYLRIPATGKRFRIGSKELIITDSPTNAIDATSYAKSYFIASGLNVQKQNTIISTKVSVTKQQQIVETRSKQTVEIMGPSCMAYSFKINAPTGEDGIFLTSVDTWIQAKHANLGVWFEIREMNSAGGITRNQVPYSEVWLKNNQVTLWDGTAGTQESNKTTITFPSPIFLLNNTEYAFVIHTEGLNPDYYFWVSRLGETDILTGKQVTSRQLTGTLYTTNNNLNYDIVPDVDLKVRFNRAQFTAGTGLAYFGNQPVEFINLKNGAGTFVRYGETISSSERLSISATSSGGNTVIVGDKIVGVTSAVSGNVINIAGSYYYTDGIGFINSETYNVYDSSNTAKNITGSVLSISSGSATLRSYDTNSNYMILDNSNGKFYANAVIKGQLSNSYAVIDSFDDFPYSTTTIKPNYLLFNKTSTAFEKRGYRVLTGAYDIWYPGTPDSTSDLNFENTILSRATEIASFGSNTTAQFRATLQSDSQYVSPVIDLNRAQAIHVHNVINSFDPDVLTVANNTGGANTIIVGDVITGTSSGANGTVTSISGNYYYTNTNGYISGEVFTVANSSGGSKSISNTVSTVDQTETLPSGGYLFNKYISKTVTLADGQDAEDVIVKLTSYKPNGTDVRVWFKARHAEDNDTFEKKPWILLDYKSNIYSSDANRTNFIEFDYTVPVAYQGTDPDTGTAGVFKYTSGGHTFYGFKQYAVKIGLLGNNSANVPRVADLRVIALQK